jgi:hypothetical protein
MKTVKDTVDTEPSAVAPDAKDYFGDKRRQYGLIVKLSIASGATALLRNMPQKPLFLACFISLSARRRRAKLLGSVMAIVEL